jgi:predicted RNA-binding Zn ribbon-like protein
MHLPGTHRFNLVGGHLALDFLNTVGSHRLLTPRERLVHPEDLVSWGLQSGWLDAERAEAMLLESRLRPAEARAALGRIRSFREALFRVFLAVSEGGHPGPDVLEPVEREVRRAWAERRLVWTSDGTYRWASLLSSRLEAIIPAVALAASELLTGPDLARLRLCEATPFDGCGWFFLDTTRNRSRRWCDMRSCGNKYKARRHYARSRAARKPREG